MLGLGDCWHLIYWLFLVLFGCLCCLFKLGFSDACGEIVVGTYVVLLCHCLADTLLCSCSVRLCCVMVRVFLVLRRLFGFLFLIAVNSVVFVFVAAQCYLILV